MTLYDRVDLPITGVRLLGLCKAAPLPPQIGFLGTSSLRAALLNTYFVKE